MQYIVLDLEWNQPLSYKSSAYKSVKGKLLFEMIQIGAVKLNERREAVESFCQLIQPAHYVKLHPRVRRMTHIEQEELAQAPGFAEAIARFRAFCGEDCALLTWGCDDISVLYQNLEFFGVQETLPPMYDLQRLFGEIIGSTKERRGLKSAMEHFGIEPSEDKTFHNALNDAYYTALVFARFPDPAAVLKYPQKPRKLVHIERKSTEKQSAIPVAGRVCDALKSPAALRPACPVCGKKLTLSQGFVRQRDESYMALAKCGAHGLLFVKVQFAPSGNGQRSMTRTVTLSTEQNAAYVRTKELQWSRKLEAQERAAQEDA